MNLFRRPVDTVLLRPCLRLRKQRSDELRQFLRACSCCGWGKGFGPCGESERGFIKRYHLGKGERDNGFRIGGYLDADVENFLKCVTKMLKKCYAILL